MPETKTKPRKDERITVRISTEGKQAIADEMLREGRTESDMVCRLLAEAVNARRKLREGK